MRRLIFVWAFACARLVLADATTDPLRGQVTIYRDRFGVPHIVGGTEQATFFGYGYAQAQDHLEQMMLQYRDAQGRRSEVLGRDAVGEKYPSRRRSRNKSGLCCRLENPKIRRARIITIRQSCTASAD